MKCPPIQKNFTKGKEELISCVVHSAEQDAGRRLISAHSEEELSSNETGLKWAGGSAEKTTPSPTSSAAGKGRPLWSLPASSV